MQRVFLLQRSYGTSFDRANTLPLFREGSVTRRIGLHPLILRVNFELLNNARNHSTRTGVIWI